MASRYGEIEVTITSAKDLKNVNWRHGSLKPYAVVWVDPARKSTTRVDDEGDTCPYWDQKLVIPLNAPPEDAFLYIDVVHANAAEDTKPLIGSARLPLRDVVADGGRTSRKLQLVRPSGRPHGRIDVDVSVRDGRYPAADPYRSRSYGVRDYDAPPPAYATPYAAPPPPSYSTAPPPTGYPYGAPPQTYGEPVYGQAGYGQGGYGQGGYGYGQGQVQGQGSYGQGQVQGQGSYGQPVQEKKSKFGMGTGLAVGAVAGALGGLALAEGFDKLEDHIADKAADRVEDDRDDYRGDDDYAGGDDDYAGGDDDGGW
ncbi:hypothetical protein Nepgr_021481 [Nepenthes gracilis]|uniref:C2 domain-containing protein n=1 Tax=Nepenthes gracilis TaxID=150966 RepID=A0AAD3SXJ6_NEPGR|nr:hypothetical protein Nepgr_021481 [Nepenthes gracilis]